VVWITFRCVAVAKNNVSITIHSILTASHIVLFSFHTIFVSDDDIPIPINTVGFAHLDIIISFSFVIDSLDLVAVTRRNIQSTDYLVS